MRSDLNKIQQELTSTDASGRYDWQFCESACLSDVGRAILDSKPFILQFCGSGAQAEELQFEHQPVQIQPELPDLLTQLFDQVVSRVQSQCVVLHGCSSDVQARAIAQKVPVVIRIDPAIQNDRAITFLVNFYRALAASFSTESAYKSGCAAMRLRYGLAQETPVLHINPRNRLTLSINLMSWSLLLGAHSVAGQSLQPEGIVDYLRQLLDDEYLMLQTIGIGSMKLSLEGSQESFDVLRWLVHTGQLTAMYGYPIRDVQGIVAAADSEPQPNPQLRELEQSLTGILPGTLPPLDVRLLPESLQMLANEWRSHFVANHSEFLSSDREAILHWLIGREPERFRYFSPAQLRLAEQTIRNRDRILQNYLGLNAADAKQCLIQRLCRAVPAQIKVGDKTVELSDRLPWLMKVLESMVRKFIQRDTHIGYQNAWIELCTVNPLLRDVLLYATLEDYCLRPSGEQTILEYRLISYLHKVQQQTTSLGLKNT
ncbi:MAG TPA: hypothetical protein V6C78_23550 [Crinalium sp.]